MFVASCSWGLSQLVFISEWLSVNNKTLLLGILHEQAITVFTYNAIMGFCSCKRDETISARKNMHVLLLPPLHLFISFTSDVQITFNVYSISKATDNATRRQSAVVTFLFLAFVFQEQIVRDNIFYFHCCSAL